MELLWKRLWPKQCEHTIKLLTRLQILKEKKKGGGWLKRRRSFSSVIVVKGVEIGRTFKVFSSALLPLFKKKHHYGTSKAWTILISRPLIVASSRSKL